MTPIRPVGVALFALGVALLASLASDCSEASVQAPKVAAKSKAPKGGPKATRPSVQKAPISHVKPVVKHLPESQKTSDQQLVEAFRILRSVKKTLTLGDHDYGGHRASAVRDISKAETQIQQALSYQGKKSPSEKAAAPAWHPEPQKLSNVQLAAKVPALKRTIVVLGKGDQDYGGHRAQALADLRTAVSSLEQALKFAKTNDKK